MGTLHIHNVYNNFKVEGLRTEKILGLLHDEDEHLHLLMGDFNLHHPQSGGNCVTKNKIEQQAKELHYGLRKQRFQLLNKPGEATFRCGTTIDLAFASKFLGDGCQWSTRRDMFNSNISDHTPHQVVVDVPTEREVVQRYDWVRPKHMPLDRMMQKLVDDLQIGKDKPTTKQETELLLIKILDVGMETLSYVPLKGKSRGKLRVQPDQRILRATQKACEAMWQNPTVGNTKRFRAAQRIARKVDKTLVLRKWRDGLAAMTRTISAQKRWKINKQRAMRAEPLHLQDLVDNNGTEHTTFEGKVELFRTELFSITPDAAALPPVPAYVPKYNDRSTPPPLFVDNDLRGVITEMPRNRRTRGEDVPNQLIKSCPETFMKLLLILFNACILFGYHPMDFKHSVTIVLKKGSGPFWKASRYRPIALLSIIGKLLERLVALRLAAIAKEKSMIPVSQMAFPGRTAPSAVKHVVNIVREASRNYMIASGLSLDLGGAFNNVNRCKVLENMENLGVPDWLIKFTWSFLSNRTTSLRFNGRTSETFNVNVGIPQGSPFSPILFAFFTAPLLRSLEEMKLSGRMSLHVAGFSDDITLVAVSDTIRENNWALAKVFRERCMHWAEQNGAKFEPGKSSVIHFVKSGNQTALWEKPEIPRFYEDGCRRPESSMRILGVHLDRSLSMNEQVKQVCSSQGRCATRV